MLDESSGACRNQKARIRAAPIKPFSATSTNASLVFMGLQPSAQTKRA
jgi:hypothetical protein